MKFFKRATPKVDPLPADDSRKSSRTSLPFITKPKPEEAGDVVLKKRTNIQKVSAVEFQDLRELIRLRYALDVELGRHQALQDIMAADRHLIMPKMQKADALMRKIRNLCKSMDNPHIFESTEQYKTFQDIKRRVDQPGKRVWCQNPPWNV